MLNFGFFLSLVHTKCNIKYKVYLRVQQQKMFNSYQFLLSTYCKTQPTLGTSNISSLLIFTLTHWCAYYFPYFIDKEIETQRGYTACPRPHRLKVAAPRLELKSIWCRSPGSFCHIICFPFLKVTLIFSHCETTIRNAYSCNKTFWMVFKKYSTQYKHLLWQIYITIFKGDPFLNSTENYIQ